MDINNFQAMKWYEHKNEMTRLMRVFPQLCATEINNFKVDPYVLNYNNDIKIGVVIGTYGSVPYIELQLYYLTVVNGIEHVLIVDDHSDKSSELYDLSKKYNVECVSTQNKLPYIPCVGSNGDTAAFLFGLQWAKNHNLDILVKFSRRLIPCYLWIDDFKKLAMRTQASTFSSYCIKDRFDFRTECVGMNVNLWNNNFTITRLSWFLNKNFTIFAEFWFHEIAKYISFKNKSAQWNNWVKDNCKNYFRSGYAYWFDLLGDDRYTSHKRHKDVLWHMYSTPEQYLEKLLPINEKYTIKDLM